MKFLFNWLIFQVFAALNLFRSDLACNLVVRLDAMSVEEMRTRMQEISDRIIEIQNKADTETREFTEEEQTEAEALMAEFDELEGRFSMRSRMGDIGNRMQQATPGRRSTPVDPNEPGALGVDPNAPIDTNLDGGRRQPAGAPRPNIARTTDLRGQFGFHSFGEFAVAVLRGSSRVNPTVDNRLNVFNAAPDNPMSEQSGEHGGFAVPPDFAMAIMQQVEAEGNLLPMTDNIPISGNTFTVPVDETTPWQTTGGIQAYWENELGQLTGSRASLRKNTVQANKVTALVQVSDELMDDAPALGAYINRKAPEKINFKLNLAIVQGGGVGQPLGILNSNCLVTVAKEAAQAADTLVYENVAKMYARMYAPARRNAVWLINQDIEPQLFTMVISGTGGGVFPVYQPPTGAEAAPFGRLMGRPILPTEACETLGDAGDIILADMAQYMSITKGGIRADTSMHLYFDYDAMAFRFILRVGGQPWWSSAIARRDGSNTLSPFVTLAERA